MNKPTIGIEIELPWPTMLRRVDIEAAEIFEGSRGFWGLPRSEQDRVQAGFNLLDAQYKDIVHSKFGNDIALGNDGFAEFALRPKHDSEELIVITDDLYREQILSEDETYPLHVTLGNVACSKSAWLVLMCMEFCGGTTPERITQTNTWDRKGKAGILQRTPAELALGSTCGFEMRSLVLTHLDTLRGVLSIAQSVGAILLEKQRSDSTAARGQWNQIYLTLMQSAEQKGIDATYQWQNPSKTIDPWQQLANALKDKEWQQSTQDAVYEMVNASL